jgi:hypothetical protein
MTEPTASTPNAPESTEPLEASETVSTAPSAAVPEPGETAAQASGEAAGKASDETAGQESGEESGEAAAPGEAQPAPTILVLTEEALKPVDVEKIIALHEDEDVAPTYRVLVPADTERNMLSTFLDHLSLFEMREALDSLRPINRNEAHADADTALSTTLAEFAQHQVAATGEITADDPIPTLEEEVSRLNASEIVIVTEPHAVEDTFHRDWASRAREQLGLPVLHMYAGDWRLG